MTFTMDAVMTALGIVLVAFGLNDVFRTLLHPGGEGRLSRRLVALVWSVSRSSRHRLGSLAGPLAGVAVISTWTLIQVIGWAFIYLPHVPEGFVYAAGIDPAQYNSFTEALYISLVTLSTLGFGDVVAIDPFLRAITPLQAVVGFGLLTATITWFTQVHTSFARSRAVALNLTLLKRGEYAARLGTTEPLAVSSTLHQLARDIVQVRIDLTQVPESYVFRDADPNTSLADSIAYSALISSAARQSQDATIRASGELLQEALDDFAECLRRRFLIGGGTTEKVFRRFAIDHGHHPDRRSDELPTGP